MNTAAVLGDLSEIQRTIVVVCLSMVPFWIKRLLRSGAAKKSTTEDNRKDDANDDDDGDRFFSSEEEERSRDDDDDDDDDNNHRQRRRPSSSSSRETMRFKVTVPEQCSSGETVRIILADGTEANVTIPSDRTGGDSFFFELPTRTIRDPDGLLLRRRQQQQQQQPQKIPHQSNNRSSKRKQKKQQAGGNNAQDGAHPITEIATIPDRGGDDDGYDSIPTTHASLHLGDDSGHSGGGDDDGGGGGRSAAAKGSSSSSSLVGGILLEDFVLALAVGLLVGAAIVIGFLVGILHATEEIYAVHPIEKPKVDPRSSAAAAAAARTRIPRGNPSKTLPRAR